MTTTKAPSTDTSKKPPTEIFEFPAGSVPRVRTAETQQKTHTTMIITLA